MSKCSHGLTSAECYVCASPKYGETLVFKGHRPPPDDTALLRQALEALEWHIERGAWGQDLEGLTAALRERLGEKT